MAINHSLDQICEYELQLLDVRIITSSNECTYIIPNRLKNNYVSTDYIKTFTGYT